MRNDEYDDDFVGRGWLWGMVMIFLRADFFPVLVLLILYICVYLKLCVSGNHKNTDQLMLIFSFHTVKLFPLSGVFRLC